MWVSGRYPNGVTAAEYRKLLTTNPNAKKWGWQAMRRNAGVYVRGRVRHADHETIVLHELASGAHEHRGPGQGDAHAWRFWIDAQILRLNGQGPIRTLGGGTHTAIARNFRPAQASLGPNVAGDFRIDGRVEHQARDCCRLRLGCHCRCTKPFRQVLSD